MEPGSQGSGNDLPDGRANVRRTKFNEHFEESPVKRQVGYSALVLSNVAWLLIFALPFLEMETESKLATGSGLYAGSYALFFLSGVLLGREAINKMKAYALGFFKRKSVTEPSMGELV